MAARSRARVSAISTCARPTCDSRRNRRPHCQPRGAARDLRRTAADASRRLPPPRVAHLRSGGSITSADDPLDAGVGRCPQPCRRRRRCGQNLRGATGGGRERGHIAGQEAGRWKHRRASRSRPQRPAFPRPPAPLQPRGSRDRPSPGRDLLQIDMQPAKRSVSSFVAGVPTASQRTSSSSRLLCLIGTLPASQARPRRIEQQCRTSRASLPR